MARLRGGGGGSPPRWLLRRCRRRSGNHGKEDQQPRRDEDRHEHALLDSSYLERDVKRRVLADADTTGGNSGSPVVNGRGELVGINTGILTQSGGYQGVGFAVPSNLARRVMQDLITFGEVQRGSIGVVEYLPLSTELAAELGEAPQQLLLLPADRFGVYIDPFYDRRSGYYFLVNAAGTIFDGILYNDGWEDNSWDGVWEGKARLDDAGWTCEMRIPYSQLRFTRADRWGINFRRVIQRRSEEDFVVFRPKKESGFVSRFPDLVGMSDIRPRRSIELIPYLTSKGEYLRHSTGDPFNDGSRRIDDTGLDLRMGVGSKLTLNATANPDFGQVEADPARVNLSAYEIFFDEKRPFFIEGNQLLQGTGPLLYYSRRIGAPPRGRAFGDYVDQPATSTILGAAKLTGRLSSGLSVGALTAVTDRVL